MPAEVASLPAVAALAADTPGPASAQGAQNPTVTIHKSGPREVQVNRPATFQIAVRNSGAVPVHNVVVYDRVPRGTRLVQTTPPAKEIGDGQLEWRFSSLEPGTETVISLELVPLEEGEIGSVATVAFAAQATARAVSTRPVLKLALSGPRTVLLGDTMTIDIVVSNEGTGAAEGVILREDAPEVLRHEKGQKLEYEIGTLAPGETRRLTLALQAMAAGRGLNRLSVRGEGDLADEQELDVEVIAPKLTVDIDGPKRRYLDRKADYYLSIANRGTASAKDVDVVLQLPKGMQFIEAGDNGRYNATSHTVHWNLAELPAQKQGGVRLFVLPIETGDQLLRLEATARLSDRAVFEHTVNVDSLSELSFTIEDTADPIELGSETSYVIKIRNQGSRTDSNIRLVIAFPDGVEALDAEGATAGKPKEGGLVEFDPVPQLAPGKELIYRIRARGTADGSHLIRARVISDQAGVQVTKEEQTRVYTDR